LLVMKKPRPIDSKTQPKLHERGSIEEFSRKSRQRLRADLATVDQDRSGLALFCGMTYPAMSPLPDDWELVKGHLDAFAHRFTRAFVNAAFHWKLEFQRCRACKPEKGTPQGCSCGKREHAPHFHLIIWGINPDREWLYHFREWVACNWFEVVGSGDPFHRAAGTSVTKVQSRFGIMSYVGGYQSKEDQTLPGFKVGRYWGIVGRKNIPRAKAAEIQLTTAEYNLVRRICRRRMVALNRERRCRAVESMGYESGPHTLATGMLRKQRKQLPTHPSFKTLPAKVTLRNNDNLTLFADAWFWFNAMEKLLS
jgi:hypothetical protein